MRRYGWKNKTQPYLTTGFYEITCWACETKNVFVIDPKTIPFHNSRLARMLLASPYYRARKISKNFLGNSTGKP